MKVFQFLFKISHVCGKKNMSIEFIFRHCVRGTELNKFKLDRSTTDCRVKIWFTDSKLKIHENLNRWFKIIILCGRIHGFVEEAQHRLGPENPMVTIDFSDSRGGWVQSPPPYHPVYASIFIYCELSLTLWYIN